MIVFNEDGSIGDGIFQTLPSVGGGALQAASDHGTLVQLDAYLRKKIYHTGRVPSLVYSTVCKAYFLGIPFDDALELVFDYFAVGNEFLYDDIRRWSQKAWEYAKARAEEDGIDPSVGKGDIMSVVTDATTFIPDSSKLDAVVELEEVQ